MQFENKNILFIELNIKKVIWILKPCKGVNLFFAFFFFNKRYFIFYTSKLELTEVV